MRTQAGRGTISWYEELAEPITWQPPYRSSGDVAQLAERYLCKVDVRGSIPLVSTRQNTSSDHTKAPLGGAFFVPRCTPGAQHETVLSRFIVVMLAPVGVFQFRDWLR